MFQFTFTCLPTRPANIIGDWERQRDREKEREIIINVVVTDLFIINSSSSSSSSSLAPSAEWSRVRLQTTKERQVEWRRVIAWVLSGSEKKQTLTLWAGQYIRPRHSISFQSRSRRRSFISHYRSVLGGCGSRPGAGHVISWSGWTRSDRTESKTHQLCVVRAAAAAAGLTERLLVSTACWTVDCRGH